MRLLQGNIIHQIIILLSYFSETDSLENKDILMCLDVKTREFGGEVVDKIKWRIQIKKILIDAAYF